MCRRLIAQGARLYSKNLLSIARAVVRKAPGIDPLTGGPLHIEVFLKPLVKVRHVGRTVEDRNFLLTRRQLLRLELALGLLLVRAALSQMDAPTRSSYVMAVVTPPERAAAASVTSVPRSLAAAGSPAIAGALFAAGYEAWPLIICGVLKILYDLVLLWMFRHVKPPEEL
jgi:hypothetical protein